MKSRKASIFGFALAMIFSLALMQGFSIKNSQQEVNIQQVAVGAGYMAGTTEGTTAGVWTGVSGISASIAGNVAYGALVNTWNPLGWVGWAVAGGAAL